MIGGIPITSFEPMSTVLKLLSDQTRLMIIALLKEGPLCVCDITELLNLSQPNASQHLKKLKSGGIVQEEKRSPWIYYSLQKINDPLIQAIVDAVPSMTHKRAERTNSCN